MIKKFDNIVANPPYQIPTGPNKTQTIYDELTVQFYNMLKDNGKMTIIHPGSWRFSTNRSKKALKKLRKIYAENNIISMELNDYKKGKKTFNAGTDYDVITMIKEPSKGKTKIITKSDGIINKDLKDFDLIPTDNFEIFKKFKVKDTEEKAELLYNRSAYGTDKKWTRKNKDAEFKYPVIYACPQKGIKKIYSNTKDNGHFNISKLIWSKAAGFSILDIEGLFGLSEYSYGLVDTKENLVKIQKVFEDINFRKEIHKMNGISVNGYGDGIKSLYTIIKEFRKDFWKDFYTDEMEQELIQEGKLNSDGSFNTDYKGE